MVFYNKLNKIGRNLFKYLKKNITVQYSLLKSVQIHFVYFNKNGLNENKLIILI